MEIQLKELIDQIRKDGVEAAETEAEAILKAANEKAEKIIADAQMQADKLLSDAKKENERMIKSSEDAIRQAGRNLLISFRESVTRELNAILTKNVNAVYSSETLVQIIISIIESWAKRPDAEDITVIINSEKLKALEDTLLAGLKERMIEGVTLKAGDNFDGGFRISADSTGAYYDYSAESVVEMLSDYLSPKVTELLKEA